MPAVVAVVAALLAGCGASGSSGDSAQVDGRRAAAAETKPPTNGIDKLPPAEIMAKSRQVVLQAPSVRIKADVIDKNERTRFDLQLKGAAGGSGVLYVDGQKIHILRIRKTVYLKAPTRFWKANGAGRTSATLGKKYVKAPATDRGFAALTEFTDVKKVMSHFFDEGTGTSAGGRKGPEQIVRGQRALPLEDSGMKGWVAHIALEGKPYPLQFQPKAGARDVYGSLQFLDYDKPVALKPPPAGRVLDIAKAGSGGS
jgi:hypothetical protein